MCTYALAIACTEIIDKLTPCAQGGNGEFRCSNILCHCGDALRHASRDARREGESERGRSKVGINPTTQHGTSPRHYDQRQQQQHQHQHHSPSRSLLTPPQDIIVDQGEGIGRVVDLAAIETKNCLGSDGSLFCPHRYVRGVALARTAAWPSLPPRTSLPPYTHSGKNGCPAC